MATAKKILENYENNVSFNWNDDHRAFNLIKIVREGIPYQYFKELAEKTPFKDKDWALYLRLSTRTLDRHREENKRFQPKQSERIIELMQLMNYGKIVFEDTTNFFDWLNSKNIALGGISPMEVLDTSIGINMIKDELGRIEHGILA